MILARKKYQNTRIFLMSALRVNKMPEFYIIIARKIFSRFFFFWGGGARAPPSLSPSPTPVYIPDYGHFRRVNAMGLMQ